MAALKSMVFLHLEIIEHSDCILELLLTAKSEGTLSGETAPIPILCYIARLKKTLKKDEEMAISYLAYGCKNNDCFSLYCSALVHIKGCICH